MQEDDPGTNFFNLYRHNFVRVAVGIAPVRVADPAFNVAQVVTLMRQATERKALLVVFPELGLSAYSCEDLFHKQALLDASRDALCGVLDASRDIPVIAIVSVPVTVDNFLFNCAAVGYQGRLLGLVPELSSDEVVRTYRAITEARCGLKMWAGLDRGCPVEASGRLPARAPVRGHRV